MVMASSLLHCMPNPSTNSSTFITDTIPVQSRSSNQDLAFLKPNPSAATISSGSSYNYRVVDSNPSSRMTSARSMASKLASAWREIHGLNNWENLVEPLDPLLRQEIVRYGEFVAACYKAFDLDPGSKRYLNCKYGKRSMLGEVGLGDSGYEVTKYIYATAPDISIPIQPGPGSCCGARWIGYVAASSDSEGVSLGRRDIVITFRGTVTNPEWMANLMSSLTPARLDPHDPRPEVKVEAGFLSLYTSKESSRKFGLESCREQLLCEISRLLNKHKDEEISITIAGHSMGSSLALLLAYDIAELGLNSPNGRPKEIPVTVFSFGGPRVGNSGFKERCEELGVKVLRVVNVNDPITKMPGVLFNENFKGFPWTSCSCYAHVGVELLLDFFKMHNPSCVHDLEDYIGFLKCPKSSSFLQRDGGGGGDDDDHHEGLSSLIERSKGFVSGRAKQSFDAFQWRNAAMNMFNLVQSQWT